MVVWTKQTMRQQIHHPFFLYSLPLKWCASDMLYLSSCHLKFTLFPDRLDDFILKILKLKKDIQEQLELEAALEAEKQQTDHDDDGGEHAEQIQEQEESVQEEE